MAGYVKLFGSILQSTIWETSTATRCVWITMLAMADMDGFVSASVPGLARMAGVTRAECEQALTAFLAPDPDSRTKDFEGRRIEEVDGGWKLLNHAKYRAMQTREERREKDAERKRRARADNDNEETADGCGQPRTNADSPQASENVRPVRPSDPDQIQDLSLSSSRRSESDPAGARSNVDATEPAISNPNGPRPALYELRPGPVTGYALTKLFGAIRARDVGGFEWQGVSVQGGRDSTMADLLNADPAARADVAPTMALLFRRAREGRAGPRSSEILTEPSLAFAAWCSSWTSLREELHGRTPAAPGPPRAASPPLPKLVAEPRPKFTPPQPTDQDHGAVAR